MTSIAAAPSLRVVHADILARPCDLLVLKHADGFFGLDDIVSDRVGFAASVVAGQSAIVAGRGIEARQVAFLGVGPLLDFRYEEIRKFGARAIQATETAGKVRRLCLTSHGAGYGLDEREAFLSLLAGLRDALEAGTYTDRLEEVEIVEREPSRARRLSLFLDEAIRPEGLRKTYGVLNDVGRRSEEKVKLFVAMPFSEERRDEWDVSISDAATAVGVLCERVDNSSFVGDVFAEIRRRIANYQGVIALITDANPNVFLELGFAWGCGKPTILLAKEGQQLPFDVRGQNCVMYTGIADLRTKLTKTLAELTAQGLFGRGASL